MIIGIDPGNSGAAALMHKHQLIEWCLMPTYQDGKRRRTDATKLIQTLNHWRETYEAEIAFVEHVQSWGSDGHVGAFTFGFSAGVIHAACEAVGLQIEYIDPYKWKPFFNLHGKRYDADEARQFCLSLWPGESVLHKKGKGQAVSDAILIAEFGVLNEDAKSKQLAGYIDRRGALNP